MARITIEDIKIEAGKMGWQVVTPTYKNLDEVMEFLCDEGHSVFSPWKTIRQKFECPVCKQNEFKTQPNTVQTKPKGVYRVLALDQATRVTGWSIYDNDQLIHYGIFEATSSKKEAPRIHEIKEWLRSMIQMWQPNCVGIEGIQYDAKKGITTYETLARLQGVLIDSCIDVKIPSIVVPVASWRAHCGVKGKTRVDMKKSMQLLVKHWFDITIQDDCADAIGIGKYVTDNCRPKDFGF